MKLEKYIFELDLIYKIQDRSEKILVPDKRYDGTNIVDIKQFDTFYIDENGIKHIKRFNPNWQELNCKWDDELIFDNGTWRVKTEEEKLEELRARKLKELIEYTAKYIETYYPDLKQRSDINDKDFHTALLINKFNYTPDYIANTIYDIAARILDGQTTLDNELEKLVYDSNGNEITFEWHNTTISIRWPWEQLIKVAIRQGWVQMVKMVFKQLEQQLLNINDINELKYFAIDETLYPPYPNI